MKNINDKYSFSKLDVGTADRPAPSEIKHWTKDKEQENKSAPLMLSKPSNLSNTGKLSKPDNVSKPGNPDNPSKPQEEPP